MFFLFLFVGVVSSQASFSNTSSTLPSSITSAALLPIPTFRNGDIPVPTICPDPGQVCWRDGHPLFNASSSNFMNPYTQEGIFNNLPVESALTQFCGSMFGSNALSYLDSANIWPVTPLPTVLSEVVNGITRFVPTATFAEDYTYRASSPCCGTCSLFGGDVQVYYWPAATADPKNVTATATHQVVDATGFVFASPSIYVAFQAIHATDLCGPGKTVAATTLSFAPDELSTDVGYKYNTALYTTNPPYLPPLFTKATWGLDMVCQNITTSFWQRSKVQEMAPTPVVGGTLYTVTYNPCSPTIAVPTKLFSAHYTWASCHPGIAGFYDPPSALQPASSLGGAPPPAPPAATIPPAIVPPQQGTVANPIPAPAAPTPTPTPGPVIFVPTPVSPTPPQQTVPAVVLPPPAIPPTDPQASSTPPIVVAPPVVIPIDPQPSTPAPVPAPAPVEPVDPATPVPTEAVNDPPTGPVIPAPLPTTPLQQDPQNSPAQPIDPGLPNAPASSGIPLPVNQQPNNPALIPANQTPAPNTSTGPAVIQVGGSAISANPAGNFVIGSQTLAPGSQIVESSTTYFLDSSNSFLIIGTTNTQLIAHPTPPAQFVLGTETITAGGPAVTSQGTVYSLPPGGSSLVVAGSTVPLPSDILVGSQTLRPGASAIKVSGTAISLQPGGQAVVVGSQTLSIGQYFAPASTLLGGGVVGAIATIGGFTLKNPPPKATPTPSTTGMRAGGGWVFNGTELYQAGGIKARGGIDGLLVWVAGMIMTTVITGWL